MTPRDPGAEPFLYHRAGLVSLHLGDSRDVLASMPAESVDCVVTSPPYWGTRDYGTGTWVGGHPDCEHSLGRGANTPQSRQPALTYPAGAGHRGGDPQRCRRCGAHRQDRQYGLEPTIGDYVENLRAVFAEVRRVLRPDGTCWLNLGDCYSANSGGAPKSGWQSGYRGNATAQAGLIRPRVQDSVPPKNLLGMPWRVAFALQDDGWTLRQAIIWHKPNAMPESVTDRPASNYEHVFLLVKHRRYHFDLDAIRVPLQRPDITWYPVGGTKAGPELRGASARRRTNHRAGNDGKYRSGPQPFAGHPPGSAMRPTGRAHTAGHPRGKNPGSVWSISTRPYPAAHFACYPIDLPRRCITAGCRPGGLVLDPFSGAATTALAALELGRRYTGIDLNPAYHDLAIQRLMPHLSNPGEPR